MKKALKIIGWSVLGIVAAVALAILALPLWIGPVVKGIANKKVPAMTQTEFNLGEFAFNQYNGKLTVGQMKLGNPEGYSEKVAASLGSLYAHVDMSTVLSDVIVIEEIAIKDVFVSYVIKDGVANFTKISQNATADETDAKADQVTASEQAPEAVVETAQGEESSKRVIINKLTLEGLKVKFGPLTMPIPAITLTDIGKKSKGVTYAELWQQVLDAVLKAFGKGADGLKALGGMLGDGAGSVTEKIGNAVDAVGNSVKGADKAVNAFKGLFTK